MKTKFCGASVLYLIIGIFGLFSIIGSAINGIGTITGAALNTLACLYFAIVLFIKKRGIPTFIALAIFTVVGAINRNIFDIIAYALLFVLALSACDKRIIKTNFFKKINFIPGILIVLSFIYSAVITMVNVAPNIGFAKYIGVMAPSYVLNILDIIAVFVVGKWLAYPYKKGVAEAAASAAAVETEAEVQE